jgi:hypothetical protein
MSHPTQPPLLPETEGFDNFAVWKRVRIVPFYGSWIDENPRPQKIMRSKSTNNTHKRKSRL